MSIETVIGRMEDLGRRVQGSGDDRQHFHSVYLRTTRAVAEELRRGTFSDPEWVERWDVVFADLYLDALEDSLDGRTPSRPWAVAFDAAERQATSMPPLRHVLLGMNAHINYDLPQALIAVISPEEFRRPEVLERRERDHLAIDTVLLARVGSEDQELAALGPRSLLDRILAPLNRLGTKRFLTEARRKVWHNALQLDLARRRGDGAYRSRLAELEELCAARVRDLTEPGQVLLKLAARGFGVRMQQSGQQAPSPGRV
jgi:hypothetical protein